MHFETGEVPEWSIGPHSKCGERATVPGVRIPLSPQRLRSKKMSKDIFLLRRLCLGLCGEQRGWALSDAVCIVANPSLSADFDAEQMTFQSSVFVFGIIRTIGTLRQLRWLRPTTPTATAPAAETTADTRPHNGLMVLMVLKKIKILRQLRPTAPTAETAAWYPTS